MPTRNVVLTNYQASFVERLVSGVWRLIGSKWVSFWAWASQTPLQRARFVYCDYSFISVMLPPMILFKAPRRLP